MCDVLLKWLVKPTRHVPIWPLLENACIGEILSISHPEIARIRIMNVCLRHVISSSTICQCINPRLSNKRHHCRLNNHFRPCWNRLRIHRNGFSIRQNRGRTHQNHQTVRLHSRETRHFNALRACILQRCQTHLEDLLEFATSHAIWMFESSVKKGIIILCIRSYILGYLPLNDNVHRRCVLI